MSDESNLPEGKLEVIEKALDKYLVSKMHDVERALAQAARGTAVVYWQVGDYLNKAREMVPHGSWRNWLVDRGIHYRTAHRCMRIRNGYEMDELSDARKSVRGLLSDLSSTTPMPQDETETPAAESPPPNEPPTPDVYQVADQPAAAELPGTKPAQEVLVDEDDGPKAQPLTREDQALIDRDAALEKAAELQRERDLLRRDLEKERLRAEATGSPTEQTAGVKVLQAENRVDELRVRIERMQGEMNALQGTVASLRRKLGRVQVDIARAYESGPRDDLEAILHRHFDLAPIRPPEMEANGADR